MRVITLNVNGIRSAAKKGLFDWLASVDADVICLQEIKADITQMIDPIFSPLGYHRYVLSAQKKGYSGVAMYAKQAPKQVHVGMQHARADAEGRYVQLDYDHYSIASIYMPSGSSGPERQAWKFELMDYFMPYLKRLAHDHRPYLLCGDWNIAHKPIDLKNWRSNQKNSGFLPEERAWLDVLFNEVGFVDAFRVVNDQPEQYTWWSNRGRAWEKNVGWRIDYQVVSPSLKSTIKSAWIYKEQRFSDHAPLVMDYDL